MKDMNKKCQNCERDYSHRRSDSKFCSPRCGWNYRNHLKKEKYKAREAELKKLNKNAKILEKYYNSDRTTVPKNVLEFEGFDFNICTTPVNYDKDKGYSYHKMLDYWVILYPEKNLVQIQKI